MARGPEEGECNNRLRRVDAGILAVARGEARAGDGSLARSSSNVN